MEGVRVDVWLIAALFAYDTPTMLLCLAIALSHIWIKDNGNV